MIFRFYCAIFLLATITTPALSHLDSQSTCSTPLKSPGVCKFIRECDDMIDYLSTKITPWTEHVQKFIDKSKCDLDKKTQRFKICCPHKFVKFDEEENFNQNANPLHKKGNIRHNDGANAPANTDQHSLYPEIIWTWLANVWVPFYRVGNDIPQYSNPNYQIPIYKSLPNIPIHSQADEVGQHANGYSNTKSSEEIHETIENSSKGELKKSQIRVTTSRPNATPKENKSNFESESQNSPILNIPQEACGKLEANRVLGVNTTGVFDFPWMALLVYDNDSSGGLRYECGGTIISSRFVLTAASCLKPSLIGVRVGEHDTKTEEDCQEIGNKRRCAPAYQDFLIDEIINHPSYDGQYRSLPVQHDIGLIRLEQDIEFSRANVQPICLPTTPRLQKVGLADKALLVAGWGANENGLQSETPIKSNILPASTSDCEGTVNRSLRNGSAPNQLCAGRLESPNFCGGDSGGPLMLELLAGKPPRFVQYGVIGSGPSRCGSATTPGMYANVVHYMDWILETTAQ